MSNSTQIALSISIAVSILSASALGGEASDGSFRLLSAFRLPQIAELAPTGYAETVAPTTEARRAAEVSPPMAILVSASAIEGADVLAGRREAFIATVLRDLQNMESPDDNRNTIPGESL